MTAEQILTLARKEIGTTEAPPNSDNVKYNTAYYGRKVSGGSYAWCAVFLWWLFREAGAPELYFDGVKTAYCPTLLGYYQYKGQVVTGEYCPGDIIFFNFNGKNAAGHVGLCEAFDGTYITTIDGNTGEGNEANGGAVMRRRRHKKYIVGAARPSYSKEEDNDVTQEQFDKMMVTYLSRRGTLPPSKWAKDAETIGRATRMKISDGDRPQSFSTREEVWQMILLALEGLE